MARNIFDLSAARRLSKNDAVQKAKEFMMGRECLNGEVADVESQLRFFEQRYEIPSSEVRTRLENGTLKETFEICKWLMLIRAHENLVSTGR